jgi:hypothetical protein
VEKEPLRTEVTICLRPFLCLCCPSPPLESYELHVRFIVQETNSVFSQARGHNPYGRSCNSHPAGFHPIRRCITNEKKVELNKGTIFRGLTKSRHAMQKKICVCGRLMTGVTTQGLQQDYAVALTPSTATEATIQNSATTLRWLLELVHITRTKKARLLAWNRWGCWNKLIE